MFGWVEYGLVAAVAYGLYVVFLKLATAPEYANNHPPSVFRVMLVGVLGVSLIPLLAFDLSTVSTAVLTIGTAVAFAAGVVGGFALLIIVKVLSNDAPVAKLTPLYNANTVIAAAIGIVFLNETQGVAATILGVALVFVGGVLAARGSSRSERSEVSTRWKAYGVLAAVLIGAALGMQKIALSPSYYHASPFVAFTATATGMFLAGLLNRGRRTRPVTAKGYVYALLAGILWAAGGLATPFALINQSTNVSALVPLTNTNTLIATAVGLFILHEAPTSRRLTLIGAVLVVLGGTVVSAL